VLVDHELTVGAVDGVVQHGPVKPDLDVRHRAERPVQHERVADLGGHGVTNAFFFAALCGVRPAGVRERDPHGDARAALISENPEDPGILGQEQRTIGKYRDVALG
jgi:hypothetical protein